MKTALCAALMWVACLSTLHAQWSNPIPLFAGSEDQTEISFASKAEGGVLGNTEWMAFVRSGLSSSTVAVGRSVNTGSFGSDSLEFVTPDSVWADKPTLAMTSHWNGDTLMVVYRQLSGIPGLYYAIGVNGIWSLPQPVATGTTAMNHPSLVPTLSGFALVWERDGGIYFSRYRHSTWSSPIRLSEPNDSTNHCPSLRAESWSSDYVAVWEKLKGMDSTRYVAYAVGSDTGWFSPDTLVFGGDNRRPRFVREGFAGFVDVMYESDFFGAWKICGASGYVSGSDVSWFGRRDTLELFNEPMPPGDQHESSFMIFPIITREARGTDFLNFVAGAWRQTIDGHDSIVLKDLYTPLTRFGTSIAGVRRPDISGGMILSNSYVRVWAAWESFNNGHWQVYGSYNDLPILAVPEIKHSRPRDFELLSNYPNPFNPSTTISYRLTRDARVSLVIYNMTGQEVRRVFREDSQAPGSHHVEWDGTDTGGRRVASGVYIYRLSTSSGFATSQKMLLVK